jgi:hypothetical protein
MAIVGSRSRHVRITAPWVQVTAQVVPVGSVDPDLGGSILAGEDRDSVKKGRTREIYLIAGKVFPSGPSATKRVVTALEAQGYRIVEHEKRTWLFELVDPSAPEDAGDSEAIEVAPPAVSKFFDWLQRKIDERKQR